jgi:hypothetical protein
MSAYASRCKFRASGNDSMGMARSSVAAATSLWLVRGGVFGSSTLKSTLMRSQACFPSSRTRSPRAEASPAMEARRSRTARYSSASFASSSCAWASCVLMSAPPVGEVGGRSTLGFGARSLLGPWGVLRHPLLLSLHRRPQSTRVQGHDCRRSRCRSSRTSSPRR